jgi:hypothetical protein
MAQIGHVICIDLAKLVHVHPRIRGKQYDISYWTKFLLVKRRALTWLPLARRIFFRNISRLLGLLVRHASTSLW